MSDLIGIFKKSANKLEIGGISLITSDDREQCPCCKVFESKKALVKAKMVCPKCGHHFTISARERMGMMADKNSYIELFSDVTSRDFMEFPGYQEKLNKAANQSGESEGVICGTARFGDIECSVFIMEPSFMMGSMGSAVGERITRTFEYATEHGLPVIGFTASGGARMQEGIISLMQMAKISGAVKRHSDAGNLYITVLTNPTTGGVTASFAMLGDIILSEPKALIGFAGKRVIEQTTKRKLSADFQSAEFNLSHGFVDEIVPRGELQKVLRNLVKQHQITQTATGGAE